jgi:hypothetical protein
MHKYHIALSFAGEDRPYVEEVASSLRKEGVDVFYDRYEEATLWGKDLYAHLSDVYQNKALFTVMFISEAYRKKLWTNHERKSAQTRAFSDSKEEYILPAVFDESIEVPGLLKTTGYISLKKKTPEQLSELIVQKLKNSGALLTQSFSYSDSVKADIDFPLHDVNVITNIINDLKSYTWSRQNSAVARLLDLDLAKVSSDEVFVLGRNLYQCACGKERKSVSVLANLRQQLAKFPEGRAFDLLNGMFFEVYFNSKGEFRGTKLKTHYLSELLALQAVKKFSPSITFIRRALEPYRTSLLFMPSVVPENVLVEISIRKSAPPTVQALKVNDRNLLTRDLDDENLDARLWRLSFKNFTLEELRQELSEGWSIPINQLEIRCNSTLDQKVKLRLPEDIAILSPIAL